jgi:hypothetical protein
VWNEQALQVSKEIILRETLIDALTFWRAGFRNVTASYGVNGFTDDHRSAFRKHRVEPVWIAYDRDDAGEAAALSLSEELLGMGISPTSRPPTAWRTRCWGVRWMSCRRRPGACCCSSMKPPRVNASGSGWIEPIFVLAAGRCAAWTEWGDTVLTMRLGRLEDLEYLLVHRGGRGQSFVYELMFVRGENPSNPRLPGLIEAYDLKKSPLKEEKSPSSRPQVVGVPTWRHAIRK